MSPRINSINSPKLMAVLQHLRRCLISACIFLVPLSAYAQQSDSVELSAFLNKRSFVEAIAETMFLANIESCPITLPEFAAKTHRLDDYPTHLQADAARDLNAEKHHTVYQIKQIKQINSSELQLGDVLLDRTNAPVSAIHKDVLNYRQAGFVRVWRNGNEVLIAQKNQAACPYSLELGHSNRIKAKSKGLKITLSNGLIDFAQNEHEMALIIGHEMAHLIEKHSNAGPLGITKNNSLETKADLLGIDYLTRAGFDPKISIEFWRRLSDIKSSSHYKSKKSKHFKRYKMLNAYIIASKDVVEN